MDRRTVRAAIDPLVAPHGTTPTSRSGTPASRYWFRRQVAGSVCVLLVLCVCIWVTRPEYAHRAATPATDPVATTRTAATRSADGSPVGTPVAAGIPDVAVAAPEQVRRIIERYESNGSTWPPAACVGLAPIIDDHGLPPWMLAVAWRESRCQADARNRTSATGDNSWGVFQLNTFSATTRTELRRTCGIETPEVLLDPHESVRCAAALYRLYGYRPWHAGTYFAT